MTMLTCCKKMAMFIIHGKLANSSVGGYFHLCKKFDPIRYCATVNNNVD